MCVFEETDSLAKKWGQVIQLPLANSSERLQVSDVAASLSLEYWESVRLLLRDDLLPSAVVLHRAQFEAITRSLWLAYAASDTQVSKLTVHLSFESEQAAKNMPQVMKMMESLEKSGPHEAFSALARFKDNSWKALNSYAHAGVHPISRHRDGYPTELLQDVLRNANGLALISCMHAVVLSGQQTLQRDLLQIAAEYPECMPPPL
ncbi:DUF6988 family protein [Halioglobus maricola]|uniref:DUF6988 family protein n=1 Tax=Halioglobus maricola TaxID=2601894 RepID=UPI003B849BD9